MNLRSSGTRKTTKSPATDPHQLTLMRVFLWSQFGIEGFEIAC